MPFFELFNDAEDLDLDLTLLTLHLHCVFEGELTGADAADVAYYPFGDA